jgi:hypothetical protein
VGKINPFGGQHIPVGFMSNYDMMNDFFSFIYDVFSCVGINPMKIKAHERANIFKI